MKKMTIQKTKPVLVFDVNETLLDMTPLKEIRKCTTWQWAGFRIWFGTLLHYSIVSNSINEYHDFGTIGSYIIRHLHE
jgi:2-haloacid dehalogenase